MPRRLLKKDLAKYLEGGMYHTLLEVVKKDLELEFEIRVKNEVMIYCEKCMLLTIRHNITKEDGVKLLDPKYMRNRKDGLRLTAGLSSPADLQDREKVETYFLEAKRLCQSYKRHNEFVLQQLIKKNHSSFEDDYLIVDMEWAPEQDDIPVYDRIEKTRIDLVMVSNKPNSKGCHEVYLAEVKFGLSAIDGQSGMEDHLRKSECIIRKPLIAQKLLADVRSLIRQKTELGLFADTPVRYNLDEVPRMMFVLVCNNADQREAFGKRVSEYQSRGYDINVEYLMTDDYTEARLDEKMYEGDSAFKAACRRHQVWFRESVLKLPMGENPRTHRSVNETEEQFLLRRQTVTDTSHLTDVDASRLMNFVPAFHDEIRRALHHRYGHRLTHDLMNDMLRSENIPWNIFVPLMQDELTAIAVLRSLTGKQGIARLTDWKIEYNPKTLADNSAFDAYVAYEMEDGRKGIVGFEVKYTEEGYKVSPSELARIQDPTSSYAVTTRESGCFAKTDTEQFNNRDLIQVWRNHMLALSMKMKGLADLCDSVTIYPSGNTHFHSSDGHVGVLETYAGKLTAEGRETFHYKTFEELFSLFASVCQGQQYDDWVEYLGQRYLPTPACLSGSHPCSSAPRP